MWSRHIHVAHDTVHMLTRKIQFLHMHSSMAIIWKMLHSIILPTNKIVRIIETILAILISRFHFVCTSIAYWNTLIKQSLAKKSQTFKTLLEFKPDGSIDIQLMSHFTHLIIWKTVPTLETYMQAKFLSIFIHLLIKTFFTRAIKTKISVQMELFYTLLY